MHEQAAGVFPTMLKRSAFNERVRNLWGLFVKRQVALAEKLRLSSALYVSVACEPLPAYSNGQALKEPGHWLWESTAGHGGTSGGWYQGDKLLGVVSPEGVIEGWLLGNANIQDRWLLEGLVSARAGQACLRQPHLSPKRGRTQQASPPLGHIGPFLAVGQATSRPYLADRGFNGDRWPQHWLRHYGADVITVPPTNSPLPCSAKNQHGLASHRQPIDTAFAFLNDVFALKHLNAHSRWGQYTRVAAIMAAYNLGVFLNRSLARPLGATATLLC